MSSESRLAMAVDLLLDREDRDEELLLVVDQLEELFTERRAQRGDEGNPPGGEGSTGW